MAKFIKVTRNIEDEDDRRSVWLNIDKIEMVAFDADEKATDIYLEDNNVGGITETPEEIHALIQEAQGAGEVEEELDIDLCDTISVAIESGEVDPGDILQMVKDAVK